jgi:hypothetical protein
MALRNVMASDPRGGAGRLRPTRCAGSNVLDELRGTEVRRGGSAERHAIRPGPDRLRVRRRRNGGRHHGDTEHAAAGHAAGRAVLPVIVMIAAACLAAAFLLRRRGFVDMRCGARGVARARHVKDRRAGHGEDQQKRQPAVHAPRRPAPVLSVPPCRNMMHGLPAWLRDSHIALYTDVDGAFRHQYQAGRRAAPPLSTRRRVCY